MKKVILIHAVAMLLSLTAAAQQDKKVAVFDPAGDVSASTKEIVREEISALIVDIRGYAVLERQMIDRVLQENKFQASGMVDDSQISRMGKLMGANLALVTSITSMGDGTYYISCKLINVETARIEKQDRATPRNNTAAILGGVQEIIGKMFGVPYAAQQQAATETVRQPSQPTAYVRPPSQPAAYVQPTYAAKNVRYQPKVFGLDFGGMFFGDTEFTSYLNLGMRYTRNIVPNVGLDIIKLSVSAYSYNTYYYEAHASGYSSYDSYDDYIFFDMLTGVRFSTNRFGRTYNNIYFYTALRAGPGWAKQDYNFSSSSYGIRASDSFSDSYPTFATELDAGIHFRYFFFGATASYHANCPKIAWGLRFGFDIGSREWH